MFLRISMGSSSLENKGVGRPQNMVAVRDSQRRNKIKMSVGFKLSVDQGRGDLTQPR